MKMSDYFFNGGVDFDEEGCLIENGFKIARGICKYKASAISHAVSNHDRLTEENAKLREVLEYAVKVANDKNATYTAIDVLNAEVQQLINQLKDQNNDK